jgi:xanthine dehydrogenase accessory factor
MRADLLRSLERAIEAGEPVVVVTVLGGPAAGRQMLVLRGAREGSLGRPELDSAAAEAALAALPVGESRRLELVGTDAFLDVHPAPAHLVVVGAVHVAIPLVSMARMLGYRTSIVDPRASFATAERFGHADEIVVDWPGEALARIGIRESTCVAVLAHDLKIELPAILAAFAAGARYVGVLGSRKTHARRLEALRESGATEEQLARLRAPIGLDLGARSPEEIALSIAAELVQTKRGHSSFPADRKR